MIPLLMYFFDLSTKLAIEISYIIVFSGAIGNYLRNCTVKSKYGGSFLYIDIIFYYIELI